MVSALKDQQHYLLQRINSNIRKKIRELKEINFLGEIKNAFFYLVNTGCALTSFIFLEDLNGQKELWCFDYGVEKGEYFWKNNVEICLKHIRKAHFDGGEMFFNKLFLSHPHVDHHNQIESSTDYISNKTEEAVTVKTFG